MESHAVHMFFFWLRFGWWQYVILLMQTVKHVWGNQYWKYFALFHDPEFFDWLVTAMVIAGQRNLSVKRHFMCVVLFPVLYVLWHYYSVNLFCKEFCVSGFGLHIVSIRLFPFQLNDELCCILLYFFAHSGWKQHAGFHGTWGTVGREGTWNGRAKPAPASAA